MLRTILIYTGYALAAVFIYTFIAFQLHPLAMKLMKSLDSTADAGVYVAFWPATIFGTIVVAIIAGPIYLCYLVSPFKRAKDRDEQRKEEQRRELAQDRKRAALAAIPKEDFPEELQAILKALNLE